MERTYRIILFSRTRLHIICSLVFFIAIFSACNRQPAQGEISIAQEGGISTAIFIPSDSIAGLDKNRLEDEITVRLKGSRESMLGEYIIDNYGVLFKPLIGLTPGNAYQVVFKGKIISNLVIPLTKTDNTVSLNAIYPSADTLPENLLKVYLNFSKPMRQGVSEKYLSMLDGKGDTLHNIFLNLNTELWDEEGKQLTVWLDPGRIKRGLQPNERDGNPLRTGSSYTLAVSKEWADLKGSKLNKSYSKRFIATVKDIQSPDPSNWELNVPGSGTRQALTISFHEVLDHPLLYNTISFVNSDGQAIKGKIFVDNKERSLIFYPEYHWSAGTFNLKIDSRLEDLAGNNLNRLFDRDLLKDKPAGKNEFYTRQFLIK
jgi:hypothetical protein